MDRRAFLGTVACGALVAPAAFARPDGKVFRIGYLNNGRQPTQGRGPVIRWCPPWPSRAISKAATRSCPSRFPCHGPSRVNV